MGLVIRGGTVVNAGERFEAEVKIEGRTITGIGSDLTKGTGDTVIDAAGKLVLPGFIDPHVHMELPFMGTVSVDDSDRDRERHAGGTTSIIDFCIPPGVAGG
jgi:dihydropyrimidinase